MIEGEKKADEGWREVNPNRPVPGSLYDSPISHYLPALFWLVINSDMGHKQGAAVFVHGCPCAKKLVQIMFSLLRRILHHFTSSPEPFLHSSSPGVGGWGRREDNHNSLFHFIRHSSRHLKP